MIQSADALVATMGFNILRIIHAPALKKNFRIELLHLCQSALQIDERLGPHFYQTSPRLVEVHDHG